MCADPGNRLHTVSLIDGGILRLLPLSGGIDCILASFFHCFAICPADTIRSKELLNFLRYSSIKFDSRNLFTNSEKIKYKMALILPQARSRLSGSPEN